MQCFKRLKAKQKKKKIHDELISNILVKIGSGAVLCSDILEPEVKGKTRNSDVAFVAHLLYLHSGPGSTGGTPQGLPGRPSHEIPSLEMTLMRPHEPWVCLSDSRGCRGTLAVLLKIIFLLVIHFIFLNFLFYIEV